MKVAMMVVMMALKTEAKLAVMSVERMEVYLD